MVQHIQQNLNQGAQALRQGNLAGAEQALMTVLRAIPQEPNALHLMGVVRRSQGRGAEAEQFYRQSLNANSNQPQVLNNLGNLLSAMKRPAEAVGQYKQAVKLQFRELSLKRRR